MAALRLRQRQAREGGGRGQITPLNLGEDKPVVGEYGKLEKEKKAKDPAELDPRPRSADPNSPDPSGITPAE